MVSDGLIKYMRENFGEECLKILNNLHQRVGVEDIEDADIEDKKSFIIEMQPFLKDRSIAKSELMITELMSILRVRTTEPSYSHIGISTDIHKNISKHISGQGERTIKTAFQEMASLSKLYLGNTATAIQKGMKPEDIEKITSRVLNGLRTKLLGVSKEIENKFNVRTDIYLITKKLKELQEKGDYMDAEKITNQIAIATALDKYNKDVEVLFNKYKKDFLANLYKKMYLEKQKIPAHHITKKNLKLVDETYHGIEKAYSKLKERIK